MRYCKPEGCISNITIIFLIFQVAALTAAGQTSDFWEKPLGPDGGEAIELAKDSTGRLYAEIVTGEDNIYISEDGGDSWQVTELQQVPSFFTAFGDGKILGVTWRGGSFVYDLTSGRRALDSLPRIELNQLTKASGSSDTFYAASDSGLYRLCLSEPNTRWQQLQTPGTIINAVAAKGETVIIDHKANIYRSRDGGQSWQHIDTTGAAAETIEILSDNTVLVGLSGISNNGIYRLPADADRFSGHFHDSLNINEFHQLESGRVIAATTGECSGLGCIPPGGILASDDGGSSWEIHALKRNGVTDVTSNDSGELLAAAHGLFTDVATLVPPSYGIIKYEQDFSSWSYAHAGIARSIVGNIAVNENDTWFATVNYGDLYRSTNRGKSWKLLGLNDRRAENITLLLDVAVHGDVVLASSHYRWSIY